MKRLLGKLWRAFRPRPPTRVIMATGVRWDLPTGPNARRFSVIPEPVVTGSVVEWEDYTSPVRPSPDADFEKE